MAGTRKLLGEIDRTLKKINEGVELFDSIWEKVYSAIQQNQKEKYEQDLKKEIKKLQRFRDQIKAWIGSSDVKDKRPLMEARKLIESKMEQFKICEKETKTKAYSKEGLAQREKLDPHEQAKLETRSWIQDNLSQLSEQIEGFEADLELLYNQKSKKNNKEEIERLEALNLRHKWHIQKLEQVTRLLDNDVLNYDDVDNIREDIDYYLEANQEPDFMETYGEDDVYEALDLDAISGSIGAVGSERDGTTEDGDEYETKADFEARDQSISSISSPIAASAPASASTTPVSASAGPPVVAAPSTTTTATTAARATPVTPVAELKQIKQATFSDVKPLSAVVRGNPTGQDMVKRVDPSPSPNVSPSVNHQMRTPIQQPVQSAQQQLPPPQQPLSQPQMVSQQCTQQRFSSQQQQQQQQQLQQQLQKLKRQGTPSGEVDQSKPNNPANNPGYSQQPGFGAHSEQTQQGAPNVLHMRSGSIGMLGDEQRQTLLLLDASLTYVPEAHDSERPKQYLPRNPYPTPAAFPNVPAALFENPAVFEKFDTDTLFFVFYYQQGTYQQYLAARELKKQNWAYHKKYMTWFKRHEEPKKVSDDYEQGTYVYFDYETGWCQRIKSEFTFEYSYLEDELAV